MLHTRPLWRGVAAAVNTGRGWAAVGHHIPQATRTRRGVCQVTKAQLGLEPGSTQHQQRVCTHEARGSGAPNKQFAPSALAPAAAAAASRRLCRQLLQDALDAEAHLGLPAPRLGKELGLGRLALLLLALQILPAALRRPEPLLAFRALVLQLPRALLGEPLQL
ncbi:MAG: hypothetical protein J3K34DRAFT_444349, partial [Monoraphidium minutum]